MIEELTVNSLVCPSCHKTFDPQKTVAMPFCSERCRMIDLHRWLNEEYSLPEVPDAEEDLESENN